jgi:hypothetical protein
MSHLISQREKASKLRQRNNEILRYNHINSIVKKLVDDNKIMHRQLDELFNYVSSLENEREEEYNEIESKILDQCATKDDITTIKESVDTQFLNDEAKAMDMVALQIDHTNSMYNDNQKLNDRVKELETQILQQIEEEIAEEESLEKEAEITVPKKYVEVPNITIRRASSNISLRQNVNRNISNPALRRTLSTTSSHRKPPNKKIIPKKHAYLKKKT